MTVYVDDMQRRARVGRLKAVWSHLLADTHDELMAMAATLDLDPRWIQHEGTHREHFDVTEPKRLDAIHNGAEPISYLRGTPVVMARKRDAARAAQPEEAAT